MLLAGHARRHALCGRSRRFLKTRFSTNEILTSLMLVYVAAALPRLAGARALARSRGLQLSRRRSPSTTAVLPIAVADSRVHLGVVFALVAVVAAAVVLMARSLKGFEIRVLGQAPRAGAFAGFCRNAHDALRLPGFRRARRACRHLRSRRADRPAAAVDLAGLRLHRHHRRLPRPAQPDRHPGRRAGAGALLSRRRGGADRARAADEITARLPGHAAVLRARLRHADPLPPRV